MDMLTVLLNATLVSLSSFTETIYSLFYKRLTWEVQAQINSSSRKLMALEFLEYMLNVKIHNC